MKMLSIFDIIGTGIKANDWVEVLDIDDSTITVYDKSNECWIQVNSNMLTSNPDQSVEFKILQNAISAAQKAVEKVIRGPIDDFPYGTSQVRISPIRESVFFSLLKEFQIGSPDKNDWIVDNPGDSFMLSLKSKEAGAKAFAKAIQEIRNKDKGISIMIESREELQM